MGTYNNAIINVINYSCAIAQLHYKSIFDWT